MGTIIVGTVLAVLAGLAIRSIISDRKKGKSSCGGDCSRCHGCHS